MERYSALVHKLDQTQVPQSIKSEEHTVWSISIRGCIVIHRIPPIISLDMHRPEEKLAENRHAGMVMKRDDTCWGQAEDSNL